MGVQEKEADMQDDFLSFAESISVNADVRKAFSYLYHHGVNETLVCYVVWYAEKGYGRMTKSDQYILHETVKPWNDEITDQLIRIKTRLKRSMSKELSEIKGWLNEEIGHSIHVERIMVFSAISLKSSSQKALEKKCADACYNLIKYLEFHDIPCFPDLAFYVQAIMKVVFKKENARAVERSWQRVVGQLVGDAEGDMQLPLDALD